MNTEPKHWNAEMVHDVPDEAGGFFEGVCTGIIWGKMDSRQPFTVTVSATPNNGLRVIRDIAEFERYDVEIIKLHPTIPDGWYLVNATPKPDLLNK